MLNLIQKENRVIEERIIHMNKSEVLDLNPK